MGVTGVSMVESMDARSKCKTTTWNKSHNHTFTSSPSVQRTYLSSSFDFLCFPLSLLACSCRAITSGAPRRPGIRFWSSRSLLWFSASTDEDKHVFRTGGSVNAILCAILGTINTHKPPRTTEKAQKIRVALFNGPPLVFHFRYERWLTVCE